MDKKKEYYKLYYAKNKEKLKEYYREYYKEYNIKNKKQKHDYYIKNKEMILNNNLNYYYENKDEIRPIQNEYYKEYYIKNRNRLLQHLTVSDYKHKLETKTKVIIKNKIQVTF
jgi:hypothetical protein